MRIDVIPKHLQSSLELKNSIFELTRYKLDGIFKGHSYWINMPDENEHFDLCTDLFCDNTDQLTLNKDIKTSEIDFNYIVEVSFKPGVTDNTARSSKTALIERLKVKDIRIASGEIYFIKSKLNENCIQTVAKKALANELIQRIHIFKKSDIKNEIPSPTFPEVHIDHPKAHTISLDLSDEELLRLSKDNLWALSIEELHQIKTHFSDPKVVNRRKDLGLPQDPVDIEMEVLAQTWSEHCKHKIFNAEIEYTEDANVKNPIGNKNINSIFKSYIKKSTDELIDEGLPWAISIFTDNAGIVRFDSNIDYCFKVETHNSPSALDPYGGALTGILGVNRDILGCGIGAKPIANTNVLCFAPYNYPKEILEKIPKKLKNPKSILMGVHRGIVDGGNKSGIPTVNGSIHFHDDYLGKPLVYCGTVGAIPHKVNGNESHLKRHRPGDYIVICGGNVGADGIHGATFSSLELDDNAPSTAVQIGDPFTQKRLMDFLIEARDKDLFNSLTDNGAGGLSSSVGEMAEHTNGAEIDVTKVPLKYPGLSPFEIVISESQERMTFSVPKEKLNEFVSLAKLRNCNPAIIGSFHDKGSFDIYSGDTLISSLDLSFLHNGLVPMKLKAHYDSRIISKTWCSENTLNEVESLESSIKRVLSNPNIKSKEEYIRQYDHEVKGATIIKPLVKKKVSGPSDSAVLWAYPHGGSKTGAISISNGLSPQTSHIDTYTMTQLSIDEAVRNAVASGTNPEFICLCDNYCWPDPILSEKTPDGEFKLAQLVRSAQALYDTAKIYKTPFVSGKDSMKNDFLGEDHNGDTTKISVPPTLLISALGKLDHIDHAMTTDFKNTDDLVFYIGPDQFDELTHSYFSPQIKELPKINLDRNLKRYKVIHKLIKNQMINSCHDVSDGGIITAVIESLVPSQLGIELSQKTFIEMNTNINAFLFNEISGGFVVSISKDNEKRFMSLFDKSEVKYLGKITDSSRLVLADKFSLKTSDLFNIWSGYGS